MSSRIKFRVYPDGDVIHQDDFPEDCQTSKSDDFEEFSLPEELVEFIHEM